MPQTRLFLPLAALALLNAFPAPAEEGMWTFDNPPLQQLKAKSLLSKTGQGCAGVC